MDIYGRRGHAGHARTPGRDPDPGGPGRDHRGPAGLGVGVRGDSQVLHALVRVQMTAGTDPDCFETYLRDEAGVAEAWRLAGDCDFEVRLCCRSLADLDATVAQFRGAGGITSTTLVLHRVRVGG